MIERPILFSASMVRALLDGTKTQTRRVFKPRGFPVERLPTLDFQHVLWGDAARIISCRQPVDTAWAGFNRPGATTSYFKCPYGQPGDRLWVREAWRVGAWNEDDGTIAVDYRADGHMRCEWLTLDGDHDGEKFNRLWIQSSDDAEKALGRPAPDGRHVWVPGASPCRWRPSIHMPRAFARILLEITDVRVQRLQEISATDAAAEGAAQFRPGLYRLPPCNEWRYAYEDLWKEINGAASWEANPLVWAVTFKIVPPAGDRP